MIAQKFKSVCLEAFAVNLPPQEVSSSEIEDRLAPAYERLKIPFGTLEKLSGVHSRYLWPKEVLPSQVGTVAAESALEQIGFDRAHIRAVLSCSVSRDAFEPATAALIHRNLNVAEDSLSFDISNACIGFSNGLTTLASLIENGVVKAGVVISGETVTKIVDRNIEHILKDQNMTREQILKLIPTFTLGSGAVAYVLCHESIATKKHRLIGSIFRSATQYNDLCRGSEDYAMNTDDDCPLMHTESSKLILSAAKLGGRAWNDAAENLGWNRDTMQHIFCHQVGKQVNEAFYQDMGLDMHKEFTIYKKYGNLVSAALPTAVVLGIEEKKIQSGEKILLTAFGSGLNAIFTGIEW